MQRSKQKRRTSILDVGNEWQTIAALLVEHVSWKLFGTRSDMYSQHLRLRN